MPSSSSVDVGPVLADDPPLVDDEDAVGEREDLLELERDEQDRAPLVALLDEPAVDELDRADVEAARGLGGQQDARVALDLAGDDDLLLVAARERRGARRAVRRRGRRTPASSRRARAISLRGNSQPKRESGGSSVVVERQVLGQREVEHEAAALAVLGDVAETRRRAPRARRALVTSLPPTEDSAALGLRRPVIASISSVWPLPSTPAIPTISPARTSKDTSAHGREVAVVVHHAAFSTRSSGSAGFGGVLSTAAAPRGRPSAGPATRSRRTRRGHACRSPSRAAGR